jgi:hypothetical protein
MLSVSSNRHASGFSNSLAHSRSSGLRDQSDSPGALHGTAQVIDSATWSAASGKRLPIQISLANTAPVASIFMPETITPSSVSFTTRNVGTGMFCR